MRVLANKIHFVYNGHACAACVYIMLRRAAALAWRAVVCSTAKYSAHTTEHDIASLFTVSV